MKSDDDILDEVQYHQNMLYINNKFMLDFLNNDLCILDIMTADGIDVNNLSDEIKKFLSEK